MSRKTQDVVYARTAVVHVAAHRAVLTQAAPEADVSLAKGEGSSAMDAPPQRSDLIVDSALRSIAPAGVKTAEVEKCLNPTAIILG